MERHPDYRVDQRKQQQGFSKAAICSTVRKRREKERARFELCADIRENFLESCGDSADSCNPPKKTPKYRLRAMACLSRIQWKGGDLFLSILNYSSVLPSHLTSSDFRRLVRFLF